MKEEDQIKKIVEKVARNSELSKNFEDIKVISEPSIPTVAFADVSKRELILNLNSTIMPFGEMLANLDGIIIHEQGHLDKRLASPATEERAKAMSDACKKAKIDGGLLNMVADLEIHHQYNKRRLITPRKQMELRKLITSLRNMCYEKDRENIILSLEYPTTELQKKVKETIEDRSIDLMEKVRRINRMLPKDRRSPQSFSEVIFQQNGGTGKGKSGDGKDTKKGDGNGVPKPSRKENALKNAKSLKSDVDAKKSENTIKEKLSNLGFSDAEIQALLQRKNVCETIDKIEDLERSFKTVIPELQKAESEEKTKERIEDRGMRISGYKRIRDISDAIKNPEDFLTAGEYDLDDIRMPYRTERRRRAIVVILRDTSGSVCSEPLAKMVRDITVTLIQMAKKKGHRIAVMDFHSQVEPIRDSRSEILTTEYNTILLDSMAFKSGYSTRLSAGLETINELIEAKKLKEVPLNIYIVTDAYVDDCSKSAINAAKVNMVGVWCKDGGYDYGGDSFTKFVRRFNGHIYELHKEGQKIIAKLYSGKK